MGPGEINGGAVSFSCNYGATRREEFADAITSCARGRWPLRLVRLAAVRALTAILGLALASIIDVDTQTAHADDVGPGPSAHKKIVIYYANETSKQAADSKNYALLLSVLRKSSNPEAAAIADGIESDTRGFPAVVRRDVKAILAAARRLKLDFAAFTNAMALDGRYLFYRSTDDTVETRGLPDLPATSSPILASSPLSRPEVFRAALLEVGSLYPANSVDAVLIANSHGSGEMALMPRVNTDLSSMDAASAMAQLLESGEQGATPPSWAVLQGTNKMDFWRAISDADTAHGIRFPLVFREACASGPGSWAEISAVPESVGALAHSAMENIRPADIDYASVFAFDGGNRDWVEGISSGLENFGIHLDTKRTLWFWVALIASGSVHPALYFMPLALWLVWYGLFRLRARLATADGNAGSARKLGRFETFLGGLIRRSRAAKDIPGSPQA